MSAFPKLVHSDHRARARARRPVGDYDEPRPPPAAALRAVMYMQTHSYMDTVATNPTSVEGMSQQMVSSNTGLITNTISTRKATCQMLFRELPPQQRREEASKCRSRPNRQVRHAVNHKRRPDVNQKGGRKHILRTARTETQILRTEPQHESQQKEHTDQ